MTRIPRSLKILALFLSVVLFVQIVPQIVVQTLASEIVSAFEEGVSQENTTPDEEEKLASMTFGNGASEQYEYDALDNLSSLCYNNSSTPAFTWTYDLSGLLKSRYDAASRITETYEYDSYSRLSSSTVKQLVDVYDEYEYEPSGTSLVTRLTTTYSYDNYGRTASVGYAFANKSYTRSVTYGLSDRIDSYTISGALSKVNSYDALNRLSGVSLKNASNSEVIGTSYDYNGMLPSSEISSFTEFYYTYDAANRITRIAEYGDDVACYAYDAQGQLIREDNAAANKTWIYTYDNYGNILTKSTYDFSTDDPEFLGSPSSVKTWSYTSSSLGKQLSHVDYDAIGNPIFDGERAWTYTWNGRLLTEIMGDGGAPIFRARYNEDGIRTHKAYSEDGSEFTYHDYILEGSLILQEHAYSFYSSDPWEDPVTYYTNYYYYDENGSLVGLNYNGTNYYYYKNILGDILGIVNSSGSLVVEYTYDAWGNILSTTGSMASTLGAANPFRYRGYYYDAETGFYYLNSRYYDPSACRFISADVLLDTSDAIGCNLYAYCGNDPVNRKDVTGEAWWQVALGVAVAAAAVAVTVVTMGSAAPAAICAATAALTSIGVSASTATLAAGVAVSAVTAAAIISAADSGYSFVTGESPLLEYTFHGNYQAYSNFKQFTSMSVGMVFELASIGESTGVCFIAGTLIATEQGQIPIEEVEAGMLVYSHDPETGETTLKPVAQTFIRESNELVHIVVNGEEIVTTPEHPFWVPNKGWTDAIHLRAGDILQKLNGEYVVVEFVQHELLENPIRVYNFEVEDFHTYFVGREGIFAHNDCKTSKGKIAIEEAEKHGYKKTNYYSHGQRVFYNPKTRTYISLDVDSHNGGIWKMARSVKDLASKDTRLGTYDEFLNWIGK